MKISLQKPPCYDEANKLFKLEELGMGTIFTYGDTIYNPFHAYITDDLIRHEEVHMEQQEADPEKAKAWWERFIKDPQFRADQECEAYGAQYKFFCQKQKDRNRRARYLWDLAKAVSGPMYGNCITHSEAMKQIRTYSEHLKTGE